MTHNAPKYNLIMMDIDLVYLWVNGSDPVWAEKRDKYIGKPVSGSGTNCAGRYADNDELMYSLRSVARYAPWIHRIFIVTDHQVPRWLDTGNPKIRIVDHTEIMPAECLPCFNSCVIEHHLWNIPGLSEHFLYANDDMFLNRPVQPETFFAKDGLPIVRFNWRPFRKLTLMLELKVLKKKRSNYREVIHRTAMLVKSRYGTYYGSKTHHNIDSYLKSDYRHTRETFREAIDTTITNRVRSQNDVQRNIYSYVPLAEGRAHLRYVTQRTSFRLHIDNHRHYEKLQRYNPIFFCTNDSQKADDDDRALEKEFLSKRFPDKSEFEKA